MTEGAFIMRTVMRTVRLYSANGKRLERTIGAPYFFQKIHLFPPRSEGCGENGEPQRFFIYLLTGKRKRCAGGKGEYNNELALLKKKNK